jgi:hypothetical protein
MAASDPALTDRLHAIDHASLERSLAIGGAILVLAAAFLVQFYRQWREDRRDSETHG